MKTLKDLTDRIAAEHGLEWYRPLNKAEDSAGMTAIDLGNGYSLHHEHSENGHDIWAVGFNGERAGTFMLRTEDTRRGKPMVAWAGLEKPHRGKGIGTLAYKALAVHYGGLDSDKASSSDEAVKAWIRAGGRQMKIKTQFGKPRYTLDGDKKRPVVQWNEELVKAPMMNEGNAWQEPVQTGLRDSDIEKIKEGVSGNHTIKTFNLPNDLYHHVITHNNRFVEHIISDDEDPFANGITRVAGDINENGHLIIGSSQTEPYHQNKGYGKLAYTQALNYHGGLVSDVDLSYTANSIWKHLKTLPNVDVKFGKKGTPQRHLATLKKSSDLNTLIQQAKARLEGVRKVGSQEPRPMIFANKDGTKHGFVTVDPSKQGQWRVTHFVNNKPAGHTEAPTFSHAIKAAHDSSYNVFKEIREEEMFKSQILQKEIKTVFHGSRTPVDKFSQEEANKRIGRWGAGVYFADNPKEAQSYGQNVYQTQIDTDKHLDLHTDFDINKFNQYATNHPDQKTVKEINDIAKNVPNPDYIDMFDHVSPNDENRKKMLSEFIKHSGYNGVRYEFRNPSTIQTLLSLPIAVMLPNFDVNKIPKRKKGKNTQSYYTKFDTDFDISRAESLTKAAHPSDLKKLANKTNPEANEIVDAAPHAIHTPDQEYVDFLNHPKVQKGLGSRDVGGISAKMVHKVGDNTYMAKPYHKRIESATRAMNPHPISGWSTIATKNLFHSAGIGHLCEDVAFHEHNGIPMTVHKFATDAQQSNVLRHIKDSETEADAKKIAIMDFLTNNLDRHGGNVMVRQNKTGNYNLLAIDHERNFQYNQPASLRYRGNPYETPRAHLIHTGLKGAVSTPTWMVDEEETHVPEGQTTKHWWKANRDNILNSFNKDIESIKDPHLKKHIHTNFMRRADWLDEFSHPDHYSFFSEHNNSTPVEIFKERRPRTDYKAIMKNLPENPYKAIGVIDGLFSKKLSFATRETLADLWNEQVDKMSGEEVGNYLKDIQKTKNHPHPKGVYYSFMNRLLEKNHRQGMQHLVQNNMIDLPYWKNLFEIRLKLGAMKKQ